MSRPTPRRSSLAGSSPIQPPEPPATTPAAAEPAKANAATPKPPKQTAPAPVIASTDAKGESRAVRQGIYMTADEFADAKSAYLADWQAGGQADTFARWIGAVIDAHAARTAAERAELARPTGRSEHRTGASRSFTLAADTIDRMRAAIAEDQAAGRWPTDSAWCGDAIAAAVERARARGPLPAAPERLPNRLRR